jgi:transposase InsO family protein
VGYRRFLEGDAMSDEIRHYNEERPHSSLDDRAPHEAYWDLPKAGYPVKLAA